MITKNLIPITICFIIISLAIAITGCTSAPPTGPTLTPTPVPTYVPLTSIGKIAAGVNHGLAINNTGTALYAWGSNSRGQLGVGDKITFAFGAKQVSASILNNVTAIAAGNEHSLAVNGGTVYAWGENSNGQLGNDSNTPSYTPVQVISVTIPTITTVAAGAQHSLALASDKTVWAWGANTYGQLGTGNNDASKVPVKIPSLTNVIAIAANSNYSLALKNDGTVWAWGRNDYGQLGISPKSDNNNTPVQVGGAGFTGVTAIAAGWTHGVALKGGTVWTWGYNGYGQLGTGNSSESLSPIPITATGISEIAAGFYHSIALSGGAVSVWGSNHDDHLGDGYLGVSPAPYCYTPTNIAGLNNVSAIAGGFAYSIVLKSDGTVYAWGTSTTGNPTNSKSKTPVQVYYQTN
jgi:alpha-tubulin suppressor-like RCC1 family protein